jgi:signal transduction histidine kinase
MPLLTVLARGWRALARGVPVLALLLAAAAGPVGADDGPTLGAGTAVALLIRAELVDPERASRVVDLPHQFGVEPPASWAERHYRAWFQLVGPPAGQALYLSGVSGHLRVALNGEVLLDTLAAPSAPMPRADQRLRLVTLPPFLLRQGANRLDITVGTRTYGSLSRIEVGDADTLRAHRDTKAFLMVRAPTIVASIMVCLGLGVLLIWIRRRHEVLYALFGLAAIAWGLHTAWTVSPRSLLPDAHYSVWWVTLYAFTVAMLALFALRFAGYRLPRTERGLLLATLLTPLVMYGGEAVGAAGTASTAVRLGMVVVALGATVAVTLNAARRRDVNSLLLVVSGLAAAGFGLRDWIVFSVRSDDNLPVQWAPFAGLPFVVLVAWFLIERFVSANESLEALNRELESRVERKSAELRAALDDMRAARDAADEANRSKSAFLAAASHDLRQPIHALGLYLGALRQQPLPAGPHDIVDRMSRSIAALDTMLEGLLDISRIDAGALEPERRAFDLAALLYRLADEFAPEAAERGLRLHARIAAVGGPVTAHSDPLLVERILRNLVANAVKYTPAGGVLLSCRPRGTADSPCWRVEVWDTGVGIAPDEQPRVFDEFYQAGNPERDRRAGLGLGLSIVRRLAQLLQLPIGLHSRPGHGTRMVLELPRTFAPVAMPEPAIDVPDLHATRVAVIEDDPEVRDAMGALLGGWGCRIVAGADADEVLQAAGAQPAQAIVADLRLRHGRNGIDEIARLRRAWGAVPAMIVSGDSAPERVRLMQDSGLPWLAKPVPAARLRSWLTQVQSPDVST